jgi:hypothetical protein
MDTDYTGYTEDEFMLDEIERMLEKIGFEGDKREFSRQIWEGVENPFINSSD